MDSKKTEGECEGRKKHWIRLNERGLRRGNIRLQTELSGQDGGGGNRWTVDKQSDEKGKRSPGSRDVGWRDGERGSEYIIKMLLCNTTRGGHSV